MSDTRYFVSVLLMAIAVMVGFLIGCHTGQYVSRTSAISNGVGHYVITDQTNKTVEFQWITNR